MKKTYSRSSMPSPRRVRLLFLTVFVVVLLILYYTADARRVQSQKFYQSTVGAMDAKAAAAKDSINDEEVLFQRLQPNHRPVVEEAPSQPKFEVPDVDDGKTALEVEDGDEERTVAGRKTMKMPKERETVRLDGDEDDAEVKEELNDILKRSPIIIFSKSYCPHSMKAKSILLEKYTIVPSPFVVELDKHPLGPKLQNLLAENTKRRTVPNVLISGRTIGGGDEISSLHEEGELVETIRSLGGKQMMEVSLKDQTGE